MVIFNLYVADSLRFILKRNIHNERMLRRIDIEEVISIILDITIYLQLYMTNGLMQSAFTPRQRNSSEIRSLDEM